MADQHPHFLIIGGTTKAATSSLFVWLQDHPQVRKTTTKEFRFFMETEYPLRYMDTYQEDEASLQNYLKNFRAETEQQTLNVDVTPDYLYGAKTPAMLAEVLPHAQLVFILRHPLSRLKSWYRFASQDGLLKGVSFQQYLDAQQPKEVHDRNVPQWQRAKEQGRYFQYLQRFLEVFPQKQVHLFYFESLKENPSATLQAIADIAGIDPQFFDDYHYPVVNETMNLKNPGIHGLYKRVAFVVRKATYKSARLSALRVKVRKAIEPLYQKLNPQTSAPAGQKEGLRFTAAQRDQLVEYYRADVEGLKKISTDIPWQDWD